MPTVLENLLKHLSSLGRDEQASSAVEWAVLASGIAAVAVIGIENMGQSLKGLFDRALATLGAYF